MMVQKILLGVKSLTLPLLGFILKPTFFDFLMRNSQHQMISASSLGSIAQEIISRDQDGIVHGITSRGLFIKTESRHIIYLTSDPFKGPLTVNLDKNITFPQKISPRTPAYLNTGNILFPDADLEIACKDSLVWNAALPTAQILPGHEQERRLKSLGEQIITLRKSAGLSWLLPYLFETPGISSPADEAKKCQIADALNLCRYLQEANIRALAPGLSEFLGSGPGLTPSGDDFVLGVMLSLNRWKDAQVNDVDLKNLNQWVVENAYRLTTTLGANLIQCAALGLADERLLNALDWIKSDIPDGGHLLHGLLEWGHSSGVDVFAGYATLLSTGTYSIDHS